MVKTKSAIQKVNIHNPIW